MMKKLGANVVRIHLQVGKFMDGPDKANAKALARLAKLLRLAEKEHLYLDLTGLGCYHKKDVPVWYDKLTEKDRWDVQARFWQAVAGSVQGQPRRFLLRPDERAGRRRAARRKDGDWLPAPSRGSTSFSSSTWTSKTGPGPTSPASGCGI